jgi:hypothetical protein
MRTILAVQSAESNGGVLITSSLGHSFTSSDPVEVLAYLAKLLKDNQFIITWEMNSFLTPIFKILPPEVKEKLNSGERAIWDRFRLFYGVGKGKFFGVNFKERIHDHDNLYNENKYDTTIYELKTFFPGRIKPADIAETARFGMDLLKTIDSMGMRPSKLTSPAAIYEECILRLMPIPTIYNMPDTALPMLEWCWNHIREWRSVYKMGIWKSGEAHDYDLSSAYPSLIAKLPNISKAEFIHTDGSIPKGATWGIVKGMITINANVSPVVAMDGTLRKGTYPDLIPVEEWECIKRRGIGDVKPEEGWFFKVPYHQPLFEYPMKRLYSYRGRNELMDDFAKGCSVVVWGKFQEMHGEKYGDFWNSIYASMVASRCRIKDCDFIYDNKMENDLIAVRVDGCISTIKANIPTTKAFGEWRLNPPTNVMALSNTFQWAGSNRPNGKDVNQMIREVTDHPTTKHWGGIHLAMLENDRNFKHVPKNGRELLANHYDSIPFTADDSMSDITLDSAKHEPYPS